jgi:predicted AAA+ superfamily ATPase
MPAVIQEFLKQQDMYQSQKMQTILLQTYRNDFGKYTPKINPVYLQKVYDKAPGLIAQHFKYVNVDSDIRSRDLKAALEMLCQAGLIYTIYATSASGLPLMSLINERKFKILFLDIGLVMRTTRLQSEMLFKNDILLVNRGELAEQFVGQELLAYSPCEEEAHLYYWQREEKSSQAEIDFIITVENQIIPIEVKAGARGRLKSLRAFMQEKNMSLGVRVSQHPLSFHEGILSVPIYMTGEIARLASLV